MKFMTYLYSIIHAFTFVSLIAVSAPQILRASDENVCSSVFKEDQSLASSANPVSSRYLFVKKKKEELVLSDRLKITVVMDKFHLTRQEAVEVQAALIENRSRLTDEDVEKTVNNVAEQSSWNLSKALQRDKAPFIIVFDMDNTILEQYSKLPCVQCESFKIKDEEGTEKIVYVAPGAPEAIAALHSQGAAIVIFTKNYSSVVKQIVSQMTIKGRPLLAYLSGIYSSEHLVLPDTFVDGPVLSNSQLRSKIVKDLRIVHADLGKLIIIDENPQFIEQQNLVRPEIAFDINLNLTRLDAHVAEKRKDFNRLQNEVTETLIFQQTHPELKFSDAFFKLFPKPLSDSANSKPQSQTQSQPQSQNALLH